MYFNEEFFQKNAKLIFSDNSDPAGMIPNNVTTIREKKTPVKTYHVQ